MKSHTFASSFENYLKLCACLNVDPAYLLDSEKLKSTSMAEEVLWKVLSKLGGRGVIANDLFELFGFRPDWPNNAHVSRVYKANWQRRFFENPGSVSGHYQSIKLSLHEQALPAVVHFAFQLPGSQMWRMYGYVTVEKEKAMLVHFFGDDGSTHRETNGSVIVQTHFGNGRTKFCLASLSRFDIELAENSDERLPLCFNI